MKAADVVKKGARLLDNKMPGWENDIDLEELDLGSPAKCIVGQLFMGDFSYGCEELFGYDEEEYDEYDVSIHTYYGFERDTGIRRMRRDVPVITYNQLDRAWVTFIKKRRAKITR